MTRSPLVVGLAGVFVGLTTVLVLVAVVTGSPVALLVAVPLALTAFLMWYHATGRLADRARRRASRAAGPRHDRGSGMGRRGRARDAGGPFVGGPGARDRADEWPEPGWYEDAHGQRWFVDPSGRRWRIGPDGDTAGGYGPRGHPGGAHGEDGGGAAWNGPGRERTAGEGPDESGLARRAAYDRLGLDPGADEEAVRAAYRDLVKEHHPDTGDGDEERFKRVTAAYERLVE